MYTCCNYTDEHLGMVEQMECTKHLCGKEVAPTTGTPHLQGRITFKNTRRKSGLVKQYGKQFSWTIARSEDSRYEAKEGNVIIDVDYREQGKRSDLNSAVEAVMEKKTLKQVAMDHPATFVRYGKGLMHLRSLLIEERAEEPQVVVLYGETGSGKSRQAREMLSEDKWTWYPQMGQWFDGYDGQKEVLFEEFRGQIPLGFLLILLDRYGCRVQYKGGSCEFCANKIIITSPCHPRSWYEKCENEDVWAQLKRRITIIKKCDRDGSGCNTVATSIGA